MSAIGPLIPSPGLVSYMDSLRVCCYFRIRCLESELAANWILKRYLAPATPAARLLEPKKISGENRTRLKEISGKLDPHLLPSAEAKPVMPVPS